MKPESKSLSSKLGSWIREQGGKRTILSEFLRCGEKEATDGPFACTVAAATRGSGVRSSRGLDGEEKEGALPHSGLTTGG
jgi:hypothetical protein